MKFSKIVEGFEGMYKVHRKIANIFKEIMFPNIVKIYRIKIKE